MEAPSRRKPRVLVVDDNVTFAAVLRRAIAELGYECSNVASGAAALDAMDMHTYDVIVVDLQLGVESGLDVLAAVAERSPHAARILMTGWASPKADGTTAYQALLQKPFTLDELEVLIRRVGETR